MSNKRQKYRNKKPTHIELPKVGQRSVDELQEIRRPTIPQYLLAVARLDPTASWAVGRFFIYTLHYTGKSTGLDGAEYHCYQYSGVSARAYTSAANVVNAVAMFVKTMTNTKPFRGRVLVGSPADLEQAHTVWVDNSYSPIFSGASVPVVPGKMFVAPESKLNVGWLSQDEVANLDAKGIRFEPEHWGPVP